MDGWPGAATFFLWGKPLKIIRMYSAKKGPAPWNLFLTPAPRPLQVTWFVGEAEHMWLQPFARTNVFQQKHVFRILGSRSGHMYPLEGQMYLWNLFLMSNLRTFSIIIIIAPFPQI